MNEPDEQSAALQAAARLLGQRERSVAEMRGRLARRGFSAHVIETVLTRLHDLGYLDDAVFARHWVEGRQRASPRGARRLRAELAQKGVARPTADDAVQTAAGDEYTQARTVAEQRVARLAAADFLTFSRRLNGFLSRRGFAPDVVHDVVQALWREHGEEIPENMEE